MAKKKPKGFFGTIINISTAGIAGALPGGTKAINKVTEGVKKNANIKNIAAVAAAYPTGGASLAFLTVKPIGSAQAKADGMSEDNALGPPSFAQTVESPLNNGSPNYYDPSSQINLVDNVTFLSNNPNRGLSAITGK